jgi:RNA polymerase sigma factor (sigma-70 family)
VINSDEQIMNRVRDGHLSELSTLFDRYKQPVYNFFLKLTLDKSVSEDLTQNLFYRIIRYRQSFKSSSGSFKSWMYQMARNLHADFCKKEKKTAEMVKDSAYLPEDKADVTEGFREDDYIRLRIALAGLGPVDRELIVLSRFEGLKYAEISKMKDISVASIKVQIHRALKELRTLYFSQ